MQRIPTQLGKVLAIASFAMLLATQWLHSPLHHVAESLESSAHPEHSESHEHHHDHGHSHQHTDSHACSHSHERSAAEAQEKDPTCPHPHPHPDDDCHICHFLAERASTLNNSVELSGVESVESTPDSVAIFFAVPIFVPLLAALLLGERIRLYRMAAIALGFIGVLIVARPGTPHNHRAEGESNANVQTATPITMAMDSPSAGSHGFGKSFSIPNEAPASMKNVNPIQS